MSINGQFRQISPRGVDAIVAKPGLAGAALNWLPSSPDPADPFAALPASMRAILASLPREKAEKALAKTLAGMAPGLAQHRKLMEGLTPGAGEKAVQTAAEELRAAGLGDVDLPEPLDIRKSWEPLHFLLTGLTSEAGPGPLGAAVLGGRPVGGELGYGPVRMLSADETAEVAAALEALGDDGAMARYDPAAFDSAGIAPDGWTDPQEEAELREWVIYTYQQVRDYYVDARNRGYGMLLALV